MLNSSSKAALFLISQPYQQGFGTLQSILGPEAPNRVIQRAVLMSRWEPPTGADFDAFRQSARSSDFQSSLEEASQDSCGWHIPKPIDALARLCSLYPSMFGATILTTNFDPLIELAFRKLEMPYVSSALHVDGSFGLVSGTGTHIVHLHEHWLRSDTLHTIGQLSYERTHVRGSIRRLLETTTVVVLGYGGWDDMFMSAVKDVATDGGARPDILWCFYGTDESTIADSAQHVATALAPLAA